MPGRPEERWQKLAQNQCIQVDETPVSLNQPAKTGERITIDVPKVIEPAVPDEIRILRETDEYLVAHKPAPMPVHPGGRYRYNSLQAILEQQSGNSFYVIHRLDVVTSGMVLFGKTRSFTAFAQRIFEQNKAEKHYLALVSGQPGWQQTECTLPVQRDEGIRFKADQNGIGKAAHSQFEVLETFEDGSTLIKALPLSGRTHQIRVHLKALGHPIVDDPLYGPNARPSASPGRMNQPISLKHVFLKLDDQYYWHWDSEMMRLENQ